MLYNIAYTKDYRVTVEEQQGERFLHCEVINLRKSVVKELWKVAEGIKRPFLSYSKNPKFCILMGGSYVGTVGDYEVFIWE